MELDMTDNRYDIENAFHKINGYFSLGHPPIDDAEAFERAKTECLYHLKNQIDDINAFDFETFEQMKRRPNVRYVSTKMLPDITYGNELDNATKYRGF